MQKKYPYNKHIIRKNWRGWKNLWVYFQNKKDGRIITDRNRQYKETSRMAFDEDQYDSPLKESDIAFINEYFSGFTKKLKEDA